MNTMTLTAPMPMRFSARALWLLTLLPANAFVAFELHHGRFDALRTVGTFAPVLPLLALVAWVEQSTSSLAIRLRTSLRLTLPVGLLLLIGSGLGAWLPFAFTQTVSVILSLVLPGAVILVPLAWEAERGTLPMLLTSPLGARALGEKFALSAVVIVTSWLQVTLGSSARDESWWLSLAGHVIALATAVPWFFFAKKDLSSLGLALIIPVFVFTPFLMLCSPLGMGASLVSYAIVMVALTPRAIRRGLFAPGLGESLVVSAPGSFERRFAPLFAADLREQREPVVLAALALVAALPLARYPELRAGMLFFLSAAAAALSPAQAFAEARRQGTLDSRLSLSPRARVFREKVLMSLALTFVMSVVAPVTFLMAIGSMQFSSALPWALQIAVVWSLALACAVELSGAAVALSISALVVAGIAASSLTLFTFGFFVSGSLNGVDGNGRATAGAMLCMFVITGVLFAERRFVAMQSLKRLLVITLPFLFFSAFTLGAAGTLLPS